MSLDELLAIPALVPPTLVGAVREQIESESNFTLEPPGKLVADNRGTSWLDQVDRSRWLYWSAYNALLFRKGWKSASVDALDLATDMILGQLAPPATPSFDKRGLVLGHIQSGKTANFTGLVAKAADVGYRLVIVLSGIDNGLRAQTNKRLKRELVGLDPPRGTCVPLPPLGRRWHEFTSEDIPDGDFMPGRANHGALQGTQPVLMVVKKNAAVLKRLNTWLAQAPADCRTTLPLLMIDDEADQASIDTRGTAAGYGLEDPEEQPESPSIINGLIRQLLLHFERRAYVAYTATPFANVLIPHDMRDANLGDDLYPRDFIIALPRPQGYFGTEELFGKMDGESGESEGGLDVIRDADDDEALDLGDRGLPPHLSEAIDSFVLAGAAQIGREDEKAPATMLVHTSQRVIEQGRLRRELEDHVRFMTAEWRHDPARVLEPRLRHLWNQDFRPTTRAINASLDAPFEKVAPHVGRFLDALKIRELNSTTSDDLDYERDPELKAVAIGGNKLSRGLTLEGLLTSYFVRRSLMYDTLLQMGRWFGFRSKFTDLIRLYTTPQLTSYYSTLAFVEHRIREDIKIYEDRGLTPLDVGVRVWKHPELYVTAANKRRFAGSVLASATYSCDIAQTFRFPLDRYDVMQAMSDANLEATKRLIGAGGTAFGLDPASGHPVWADATPVHILKYLEDFQLDSKVSSIDKSQLMAYIQRRVAAGELTRWVVCIRDRLDGEERLGRVDWGLGTGPVQQMSRTRLAHGDSLGVITSPGDEEVGLTPDEQKTLAARIRDLQASGRKRAVNVEARACRSRTTGLLLIYPISRYSGWEKPCTDARRPLFSDPEHRRRRDLIGIALSFPESSEKVANQFAIGSVPHDESALE